MIDEIKLGRAFAEIAKGLNKAAKILQGIERKKREKKPDGPMSLKEFVASCQRNRAHKILADWAELTNPPCTTKAQWQTFFKRHIADASELAKFPDQQIQEGFAKVEKAGYSKSTIRTIIKSIV